MTAFQPPDMLRHMRHRALLTVLIFLWPMVSVAQPSVTLHDRIEGLLIGAFIGDAAGGPVEFQAPQRGPWTAT
ncbi:MAG: ADP-ribosylglycohydrolase family protein, partial [Bacteroidota bacterium]